MEKNCKLINLTEKITKKLKDAEYQPDNQSVQVYT